MVYGLWFMIYSLGLRLRVEGHLLDVDRGPCGLLAVRAVLVEPVERLLRRCIAVWGSYIYI